jgi:hypothetical protein
VDPRHAVVSGGAEWRHITSSEPLSGLRLGRLAGSPKAGVAGSNPAGGTSEPIFAARGLLLTDYSPFMPTVRSSRSATCVCSRPFKGSAMSVQRRPVNHGIAGSTGPRNVPATAVAEARDVSDEDLIRPKRMPVRTAGRTAGDPLAVRGLHQLAQHNYQPIHVTGQTRPARWCATPQNLPTARSAQ